MELRHLRYFTALAEEKSFTRAADTVHVAQSTLSHQIKNLEEELGYPLFERHGGRVALTAKGALFLPSALRALREVEDGLRILRDDAPAVADTVSIGAITSVIVDFLPRILADFLSQHAAARVQMLELSGAEMEEQLRAGTLDIGLGYRPRQSYDLWFEPLYTEELVLAVSDSHPLAGRGKIRIAELHAQPLVLLNRNFETRNIIDDYCASVGVEPQVMVEMNKIVPMLLLAKESCLGAIVSHFAAQHIVGMRAIRLENPTPVLTLGMLWNMREPQSISAKLLAADIRVAAKSTGAIPLRRAQLFK